MNKIPKDLELTIGYIEALRQLSVLVAKMKEFVEG